MKTIIVWKMLFYKFYKCFNNMVSMFKEYGGLKNHIVFSFPGLVSFKIIALKYWSYVIMCNLYNV